jgi:hypothetical protein
LLDSDFAANLLQIDSRHGSPGRMKSVGVELPSEQRRGPGIYAAGLGSCFAALASWCGKGTGRLTRLAR